MTGKVKNNVSQVFAALEEENLEEEKILWSQENESK